MIQATVCYLTRSDGRVLMLWTRKDCFQRGVVNGPGGKAEPDETIEECNLREFEAETGLRLLDPVLRGRVAYSGGDGGEWEVFYFTATRAAGEQKADDREGRLEWMTAEERLAAPHWSSDPYTMEWIARAAREGTAFEASIVFDDERNVVMHDVEFG